MSNNCKIPTPIEYVYELLDSVGYDKKLYKKNVLENSCGEGNILKEIVRRYIEDAINENYSDNQIILGLQNHITAYDTDEVCVKKCKENLDEIAAEYNLYNICWNVSKKDYLTLPEKKYQYVIGNPPYVTYHDLTETQRDFLKSKYITCKQGRFDYCYAFIEAGLRDLSEDGKLAYILPYGVIRNKFAEKTREIIREKLVGIIDYKGIQVFENTVTSSVIIICDQQEHDTIFYHDKKNQNDSIIEKKKLQKQWIFGEKLKGKCRFGSYFKVANSVATLLNEAFIFESTKQDNCFYYTENGKIEKELVFDAVSTKSEKKYHKNTQRRDKIIFPYKQINTQVMHFEEDEFSMLYPECYKYLISYKEKLLKRKSSKGVKWFEYGRIQAIDSVFKEKLILSMVITNQLKVFQVDSETVPYAGAYIVLKEGSTMTLKEAKTILESKEFYNYIKECGTPTTTSSYRITVKDIENYMF